MFVILDTNHFTELTRETPLGERLSTRLRQEGGDVFVTIITAHETFGGWLSFVNRQPAGKAQVYSYLQFRRCIESFQRFELLDFDDDAASRFDALKTQHPRVGSMDLKLAAICLTHDAMLLTRNVRDFEMIEALRIENWLD